MRARVHAVSDVRSPAALQVTTERGRLRRVSLISRRLDYWALHHRWPWGFATFWLALGVVSAVSMSGAPAIAWATAAFAIAVLWMAIGLAVHRRSHVTSRQSPRRPPPG